MNQQILNQNKHSLLKLRLTEESHIFRKTFIIVSLMLFL